MTAHICQHGVSYRQSRKANSASPGGDASINGKNSKGVAFDVTLPGNDASIDDANSEGVTFDVTPPANGASINDANSKGVTLDVTAPENDTNSIYANNTRSARHFVPSTESSIDSQNW